MAASSPTPSSGTITMTQIKNAHLNSPNASDLDSYRGVNYYVPGTGTIAQYPSGEISFDDFYNKIDLQNPSLPDQVSNRITNQYPIGGCAGGGVRGVSVRIVSGGVSIFAGGFYSDYAAFGSNSFSTTYGGQSISASALSGILSSPGSVTGNGVTLGSHGRDTITLTALATFSSNVLTIQTFYQCKGGTYPNTPGGKPQVLLDTYTGSSITWSNPT